MRSLSLAAVLLLSASGCDTGIDSTVGTASEDHMEGTFVHPRLGELYPEDVDWQTDEVSVAFSKTPIAVCLADGPDDGPSQAALSGYDWLESNWPEVLRLIQDQAFEFYESYADAVAGVPPFNTPEQLWGSESLLSVRVFSKDDFTVTMRFIWQEDQDPHEITFYVEDGGCETHSVDG